MKDSSSSSNESWFKNFSRGFGIWDTDTRYAKKREHTCSRKEEYEQKDDMYLYVLIFANRKGE